MNEAVNECHLTGKVVKDIELRSTSNNHAYAKFSLAIEEGKWTNYANMTIWGKGAEELAHQAGRGTSLKTTCKYSSGSYTNGRGEKIYTYGFTIQEYEILGESAGAPASRKEPRKNTAPTAAPVKEQEFIPTIPDDDDLPFA